MMIRVDILSFVVATVSKRRSNAEKSVRDGTKDEMGCLTRLSLRVRMMDVYYTRQGRWQEVDGTAGCIDVRKGEL